MYFTYSLKKVIKDNQIESAVYVGDTVIDQNASIYAFVPFIWAKNGFGKDLDAKYSINNFSELVDLVNNIL